MNMYRIIKNKTKLTRKRALHRLKLLLRYAWEKSKKEPVFVLTTRRTGSNLLLDYLNSVPNVSIGPEILNKSMFYGIRERISKRAVLRHIRHSVNACAGKFGGAKFVDVHLRTHGVTPQDLLRIYPQARFILLYRKNLVEQFVSLKIAEKTNAWRWSEHHRLSSRLHVSAEELKNYCHVKRTFYEKLLEQNELSGRCLVLSYEDLTGDAQAVFDRYIFPFLQIPSSSVSTAMVKQNTRKPCELIENYAEIESLAESALTRQDYPVRLAARPKETKVDVA